MTIDDRLAQNIAIRGFESINGDGEYFGNLDDNSIEVIKQAILSDLLEIIGEDDDVMAYINQKSDEDLVITIGENANNRLRAELRDKVKEYCK